MRGKAMIKDLFVPMTQTQGDVQALDAAVALAEALGAYLHVVQPVDLPLPTPSPYGISPDLGMEALYAGLRQKAGDKATDLRERLRAASIAWDVRVDEALFE